MGNCWAAGAGFPAHVRFKIVHHQAGGDTVSARDARLGQRHL
ncbi:MAG TPA: hypothetical protein VEM40_10875 [Nitrospirota bacterium]|nr:hypothetical protein [Nitrospirota bacterium]